MTHTSTSTIGRWSPPGGGEASSPAPTVRRLLVILLLALAATHVSVPPAEAASRTVVATVQCGASGPFVGAWVRNVGGNGKAGWAKWDGSPSKTERITITFVDKAAQGFYIWVGCGGSTGNWKYEYRGWVPKADYARLSDFSTLLIPQHCGVLSLGGWCKQPGGAIHWTRTK